MTILLLGFALGYAEPGFGQNTILVDIGWLPTVTNLNPRSQAFAINQHGQVVGDSSSSTRYRAFLYTGGILTSLGDPGGLSFKLSFATDINDAGQIAGFAHFNPLNDWSQAFLYTGGAMHNLGSLGGRNCGAAAINNHGDVVGSSETPSGVSRAFISRNGDPVTEIGGLGGMNSFASDINDAGQIVGAIEYEDHRTMAFLYQDGVVTHLGTLGGMSSAASGVNNRGDIVGVADTADGESHAFLYSGGVMLDLGTLGGPSSAARKINDHGAVVGHSQRGDGTTDFHAFLWTGGPMIDLDIPGRGSGATDINNAGQIVGVRYIMTPTASHAERGWLRTSASAELIGLEVTQAVQDWNNSVPLIAGKTTYVRAHVRSLAGAPVPVEARLRGYDDAGGELAGSPLRPINHWGSVMARTNALLIRSNFNASLNFRLPPSWPSNTVRLKVEWVKTPLVWNEPAEPEGMANDGEVRVTFMHGAVPQVKFFSVNWTNSAGIAQIVSATNASDLPRRLLSAYPVARVDATFGSLFLPGNRFVIPDDADVNNILLKLHLLDTLLSPGNVNKRIYYGAIAADGISGLAAGIPSSVSSGRLPSNPFAEGRHTHSHEIGHNLGLHHATDPRFGFTITPSGEVLRLGACREVSATNAPIFPNFHPVPGITNDRPTFGPMADGDSALVFGLDTLTLHSSALDPVLPPQTQFDVMSYCSRAPLDFWPAKYTYLLLHNAISNRFGVSEQGNPAPVRLAAAQPFLIVRGRMDFAAGTAEFLPFTTVTTSMIPPGQPLGDYRLELSDAGGNLVQEVLFAPTRYVPRGEDPEAGGFLIPVPADPAIRHAKVVHEGETLASLAATPAAPTVTVQFPNGGETLPAGDVEIRWQGADADNDPLTYVVQYSADGGAGWETLAADVTGTALQVNTSMLRPTINGLIRVVATDGFLSASDDSDGPFTVANSAPAVTILMPAPETVFAGEQGIVFEAEARDQADGEVPPDRVQWSSSLDGSLGTGSVLHQTPSMLTEGNHLITVSAANASGDTNTAAVSILVLRLPVPALNAVQSTNGVLLSWPATATNYVLESTVILSASSPSLWVVITNAPAISNEQQVLSIPVSGSSQFFRLRRQN